MQLPSVIWGGARLGFISVRASLSHTFLSDSFEFYFRSCQGQIKWLHEWENAGGFETDGWLCRLSDLPGAGLCCHMNGNPIVAGFLFLQPMDDSGSLVPPGSGAWSSYLLLFASLQDSASCLPGFSWFFSLKGSVILD